MKPVYNIFTILFYIITLGLSAQEAVSTTEPASNQQSGQLQVQGPDDPLYHEYISTYPLGERLNARDSAIMESIPELQAGAAILRTALPPVTDNSTLPYLRPVFGQEGASCGQATSVGYNFTYEINHLRGLPADTATNQYATHFTWNFMNYNGWYGVSYFHSFEILRLCGNPNVEDYGGTFYDDGLRWITGYDKYYNSMHNRINQAYYINTSTEEGIITLKNWIFNHLGHSSEGGIGSFYANVPWNVQLLNDTTPEGGSHVLTGWYPEATHAMTIIGYNDSIRWDYNNDGEYTNDIDLNGDGTIDPKDWEIGGVRFVNSHGDNQLDSGFCYMMYKVLADKFEDGGIWNNTVHVLDAKGNYEPLLTMKIQLKHDNRQMVRVRVGVSPDTSDITPEYIMEFPIFNFQGADNYMQGTDTAEFLMTIEFGLDITPLQSHFESGEAARFFILIDENDPLNFGSGELVSCTVIDYNGQQQEIPMPGLPIDIKANGMTIASTTHNPSFEHVSINTTELPAFTVNQPYGYQLSATGGSQPYLWSIQKDYNESSSQEAFPEVTEVSLIQNPETDFIIKVPLDFAFPFYGEIYDTVYLNTHGFIQFDEGLLPWPYLWNEELQLRTRKMIAPFSCRFLVIDPDAGDGAWYSGNADSATFRWKASLAENPGDFWLNVAATIFPSGEVKLHYGDSYWPPDMAWAAGISRGDNDNYCLKEISGNYAIDSSYAELFFPYPFPGGMGITEAGFLSGIPTEQEQIYDVNFKALDNDHMFDTRTLQLSSGLLLDLTAGLEGGLEVDYGDSVWLSASIKNISSQDITNIMIEITSDDPYVNMVSSSLSPGDLQAGKSMDYPDAFLFIVSYEVPDQHILVFDADITSDQQPWHKDLGIKARAPRLIAFYRDIIDGNDGILDPGESGDIIIAFQNTGHAPAYDVLAQLMPDHPDIIVNGNPVISIGDLDKGQYLEQPFNITAGTSIPYGLSTGFEMYQWANHGIEATDFFEIRIGRLPVLVVDMDPLAQSGPAIDSLLNTMDILSDYTTSIPLRLEEYQSLFICLGTYFSHHELGWGEGVLLEEYLNGGGRIYMEGRTTWMQDPYVPTRSMFNIEAMQEFTLYDTLTGTAETFTEGMTFLNSEVYPLNQYHIRAENTAWEILENTTQGRGLAIANEEAAYKTVGTIIQLGQLVDGEHPSTREELITRILEFFDVIQNTIGIDEAINSNEQDQSLKLYPNPASHTLQIEWAATDLNPLLEIYDIYGRKMDVIQPLSGKNLVQINTSGYPGGVYFAVVKSSQKILSRGKFIISH